MQTKPKFIARNPCTTALLGVVSALLFVVAAPASAELEPTAPLLCVGADNDCESSTSGGASSNRKKWNPGHYIKPQGNHAQADTDKYISSVTTQLSKVNASPQIRGAHIGYAWGVLEPSTGVYNWDPIYTHVDYLSARGKKLIVQVLVKCFDSDCANLVPADLTSEVYVTPREAPTSIVKIWEKRNMDAFIDFWQAMAAEFDDNPTVEMIVGAESVPTLAGSKPESFTRAGYAAQLKRMYTAQTKAFKNTNVIANVNWLGGEVANLIEHAYQEGAGRGLPDIFDSAGSFVFRGECYKGDCGARDYRGQLAHFGVVSTPTLKGKHSAATDTPQEVIAYGVANSFTHFSWVPNERGEDSLSNIIKAIEAASPNGYTRCPDVYKSCK